MFRIRLRRAHDRPGRQDGQRILVDRLWPRGISKDALALAEWMKALAPSAELRKWFGHDPEKWEAFRQRYWSELDGNPDAVDALRARVKAGRVTLVFGARDVQHNNAVALRDYIETR